jgi:GNAT superfamily N-acetyltransferase
MHLEFVELKAKSDIKARELRARAGEFPGSEINLRYVVQRESEEVAFLWCDVDPAEDYFVLYELFVAERFRGQGIGSELLRRTQSLAAERGYKRILVRPKPLSREIKQEDLVKWYEKNGFTPMLGEPGIYIKDLLAG